MRATSRLFLTPLVVPFVLISFFGCGDDVTVTGPEPLHEVTVRINTNIGCTVTVVADGIPLDEFFLGSNPLGHVFTYLGNTVCVTGATVECAECIGGISFSIQVGGSRVETTVPAETISVCNQ